MFILLADCCYIFLLTDVQMDIWIEAKEYFLEESFKKDQGSHSYCFR